MELHIQYGDHRYFALGPDQKLLAEITFPARSEELIEINHTFVDPSLRGQGVADLLMQKAVAFAEERKLKILPTCAYAVKWLDKHPEYQALLSVES